MTKRVAITAAAALALSAAALAAPAAAPKMTLTIAYTKAQVHYSGKAVAITSGVYVKAPKGANWGEFTLRTTIAPAKFKRSTGALNRRALSATLVLTTATRTLTYTFDRPWIEKIETVSTSTTGAVTVKITFAFLGMEVKYS
jgi:hypothetical protein